MDALRAEWARHPPVHHLVASYLGYKPPAVHARAQTVTDVEDMLTEIGGAPIRIVQPLDTFAFDDAMRAAKNG